MIMAKLPSEPMILLPYSELMELLEASKKVIQLTKDMKRLQEQQSALRYQFIELMERLREFE